jgi:hypothetical protein
MEARVKDLRRIYGYQPSSDMLAVYNAANVCMGLPPRFLPDGHQRINSRAELRNILRDAGLAKAAAERVAAAGWPALSPEEAARETAARIRAAARRLRSK